MICDNFINNNFETHNDDTKFLEVLNPSNGEPIGKVVRKIIMDGSSMAMNEGSS